MDRDGEMLVRLWGAVLVFLTSSTVCVQVVPRIPLRCSGEAVPVFSVPPDIPYLGSKQSLVITCMACLGAGMVHILTQPRGACRSGQKFPEPHLLSSMSTCKCCQDKMSLRLNVAGRLLLAFTLEMVGGHTITVV